MAKSDSKKGFDLNLPVSRPAIILMGLAIAAIVIVFVLWILFGYDYIIEPSKGTTIEAVKAGFF